MKQGQMSLLLSLKSLKVYKVFVVCPKYLCGQMDGWLGGWVVGWWVFELNIRLTQPSVESQAEAENGNGHSYVTFYGAKHL